MIHTATIKIKVVLGEPSPPPPPPPPPFVGTKIKIAVPTDDFEYRIYNLEMAGAGNQYVIDWGDGETTVITSPSISGQWHVYAKSGVYEIRIPDNLNSIQLGTSSGSDERYVNVYPQMVRSFVSNATNLSQIKTAAFYNCSNMTEFSIPVPPVTMLNNNAFTNCSALQGRIDLPHITGIGRMPTMRFFTGCTGLTEIHFPAASEAAITSASPYKADPTLGSGNAVCVFDL